MFIIKNQNNAILHSDGGFYFGFFCGIGFMYCIYKYKANAEKKLKKISRKYPNMQLYVEELKSEKD